MFLSRKQTGAVLAAPAVGFMLVFFLAPCLVLLAYSFFKSSSFVIQPAFVVDSYWKAITSNLFWKLTWNSVSIGLATASIALILAIPVAFYLAFATRSRALLYLVLLTWFSSYLVRIYAWRTLLGTNGLINALLIQAGLIDQPIDALIFSSLAVTIALTHVYLPICIMLVYSAMSEIKRDLLDAARDLGTSPIGVFKNIIVPNAANGLVGAFMMTFILVAGDYVTPQMIGGSSGQTTGLLIADQFRKTGNWPLGAAQAFIIFLITVGLYAAILFLGRMSSLIPTRRKPGTERAQA